ncbi:MAG TPA: PEP-CTERM sorting domain-containing protein [Pirellulales bacterium]|jgi:hypothetical protein|nr:PEP-CTERM sorting domain-containing protein [Pirellulales bacterium]
MTTIKSSIIFALLLHLAGIASLAQATGITQAGFNDATGINSNPTPNSPYTLGGSVTGAGIGEPGWAAPWYNTLGTATVQTSTVFEGDGALQLTPTTSPARQWTAPLQGQLIIEQYVSFTEGARLVAYTQQGTSEATTEQGPIWQAFPDHHFNVIDGSGDGGSPTPTVTNFTWQPGVWYKVTVHADVATQTWDFAVNDVPYVSANPLGYRGSPTSLSVVHYLSEGSGLVFLDAVTVVPEPSSIVLAVLGLIGLTAWGWRRRER